MTEQPTPINVDGQLIITVSEFAGTEWRSIADRIPFAKGFSLESIKEMDSDPFFVTLPVARVGSVSKSQVKLPSGQTIRLRYGQAANESIVSEIMSKQPEGGQGHIKPEDEATKYDLPDVMAVGAMLENDTTWVKLYVPSYAQATRDYYRIKMRANAQTALSMWGQALANPITGEANSVTVKRIDMADPSRAGLDVAAVPVISRNMASGEETSEPPDLTPDPAPQEEALMPEGLEVQLSEMTQKLDTAQTALTTVNTRMAEMAGLLGVDQEKILERVRELQAQVAPVAEMARLLSVEPSKVLTTVTTLQQTAAVATRVAEMLHEGGGDPDVATVPARITEMQTFIKAAKAVERRQRVTSLIDGTAMIKRDDGTFVTVEKPLVELEDLRPVVIANMGPEDTWPETTEAITTAVTAILARPEVVRLAEMVVQATTGGRMALGGKNNRPDNHENDAALEKEGQEIADNLGMTRRR